MKEHWIEVNIVLGNYDDVETFLVSFIKPLVEKWESEKRILTFHYFLEPDIRFRVRAIDELSKDYCRAGLENRLKSHNLVEKFEFGRHGDPAAQYEGEQELYGVIGWEIAQKYFEYGSRIALMMFDRRPLEKPDDFHAERYIHLFLSQINFNNFKNWQKKRWINEISFFQKLTRGYLLEQVKFLKRDKRESEANRVYEILLSANQLLKELKTIQN